VRYLAADHEIRDAVLEMESSAQLKIGRLNVRLQLDGETTSAHTALGMVRVVEKRADGRVVLDDTYVPPCLDCRVSGRLQDYVKELHGLVRHRIQALADRVSSPGAKGVADVSDFLLLQLCNRYEPLLAHLLTRSSLHPELFYRYCLELAGEIATYARRERMPVSFSTYRQDDLQHSFAPVIEEIRRGLTAVIEQNAVAIPVMDRGRGVFAGTVPDVELLRSAVFVLAGGRQRARRRRCACTSRPRSRSGRPSGSATWWCRTCPGSRPRRCRSRRGRFPITPDTATSSSTARTTSGRRSKLRASSRCTWRATFRGFRSSSGRSGIEMH
jgi:type VI secretion system protein ImpJ